MSKYFSYIDTALRIIYINKPSEIEESIKRELDEFLELADTSAHIKKQVLQRNLERHLLSDRKLKEVMLHEFHHYLQSFYYPFLYYLNWLEFDNLMVLRMQLKAAEDESLPIHQITMDDKIAINYRYTSYKFQLYWKNDQLQMKAAEFKSIENQVFSLNDLLEDVTSLFQYKLTRADPNYLDYYTWIKSPSNRCYKRLYLFMVKQVGKKYTYDLLPILVQAAFSTTEPVGGFCNAVSFINYYLPHYENYTSVEIYNRITIWLTEKLGYLDTIPVGTDNFIDLPVKVISHESIRAVVDSGLKGVDLMNYPLAVHANKFRSEIERNQELLYYLFDINTERYSYLEKMMNPMAIRYFFLDMKGRDSVLIIGQDFLERNTPDKMPYDFYIRELMKVKEVTQAIFTSVQQHIPHNCHHEGCPYYSLGLCRNWNSIPIKFDACGFPAWFTFVFHRKINIETLTYDKVPDEIARNTWEEYQKKSFKKRNFNYIKTSEGYTVSIGKEDFDQPEKRHMINDFIEFLCSTKGIQKSNLASSIALDFYGFDNDPRPLFAIPDVKRWMVDTITDMPNFLCYIDFKKRTDHVFILLPAYIKHEVISDDTNNFQIKFDGIEQQRFLEAQIQIFGNFIRENPTVNIEMLIENFKIITNGN